MRPIQKIKYTMMACISGALIGALSALTGNQVAEGQPSSQFMPVVARPLTVQPRSRAVQPRPRKVLYLTFDDGPSQIYTPKILDILRKYHAKATFFVLGSRCDTFPGLVRRMRREGHEIGSHGYYHTVVTAEPRAQLRAELKRADRAIYQACGVHPVLYRPPEGRVAPVEEAWIHQWGHPIVLWTVDSEDWKAQNAMMIEKRVRRTARPGAIVLFHDGVSSSRYTAEALPRLLKTYQAQGYVFRVLPPSFRG